MRRHHFTVVDGYVRVGSPWFRLWLLLMFIPLASVSLLSAVNIDSLQQVVEEGPRDTNRVKAMHTLALHYMARELTQAISYGEMAAAECQRLGYLKGEAKSYHILGNTHLRLDNYPKATDHILRCIELNQSLGRAESVARARVSLGLLYGYQEMETPAKESFDQAEAYFREQENMQMLVQTNHHRAIVKRRRHQPAEAEALYVANLELIRSHELGDHTLASTLNNLGLVYGESEDWESAYEALKEAFRIWTEAGTTYGIAVAGSNLAEACVKTGRLTEADRNLSQSSRLGEEIGMQEVLLENRRIQAQLEAARGNHAKAFQLQLAYSAEKDSLNSSAQSERMESLLLVYREQEKQNEIELLRQEKSTMEAIRDKERADREKQDTFFVALLLGIGLMFSVITGLLIIFLQIRRKRRELGTKNKELEAKNQDLAQKNTRLEELHEEQKSLVQIVVHDLKAPLNKTLGLVNLMGDSGELNPQQMQFAEMLRRVNHDAERLVRELLELNSLEGSQEPAESAVAFDVVELLEREIREYHDVASRKNIQLLLLPPEGPLSIEGWPAYLKRVLDNLISNAIKFSPQGKTVQIGVEVNGHIEFFVRDEGPGISEEDKAKLFRKFQRLSAKPTGGEASTGLGLSIVKNLVDKMGGTIKVESELGQGTEFRVCLS